MAVSHLLGLLACYAACVLVAGHPDDLRDLGRWAAGWWRRNVVDAAPDGADLDAD